MGFEDFPTAANTYQEGEAQRNESEDGLKTDSVSHDARQDIADYYQFEIDQQFSEINPNTTFEKMVAYRQSQIRDGKLQVCIARDGSNVVGTTTVALIRGTMGKEFNEDEAWAAGTVVVPEKQGQGIGEKLSIKQDEIARDAGKKWLLTTINQHNFPSMRLRMKVGYVLDGLDKRENETNYTYRKNLIKNNEESQDWVAEVEAGRLALTDSQIDESSPENILLDADNDALIEEAIKHGYRGVYLLRPEDFKEKQLINKNLVVFSRPGLKEMST